MAGCVIGEICLDEEALEITIDKVRIKEPTLYNLIVSMADEEEQKQFIERTIKIGFDVIQMMDQTNRVDYVRSEF
jgi:hypothetical protein